MNLKATIFQWRKRNQRNVTFHRFG